MTKKKDSKPQESKKVPVVPVSDDHLEWMRMTAGLNAGSGKASFWDQDIYSCLSELQGLRAARTTVYMDFETVHGLKTPIVLDIPVSPNCPSCHEPYLSIPRLGISHVCNVSANVASANNSSNIHTEITTSGRSATDPFFKR